MLKKKLSEIQIFSAKTNYTSISLRHKSNVLLLTWEMKSDDDDDDDDDDDELFLWYGWPMKGV